MPNVYIRIFPTGQVLYSIRYECKEYRVISKVNTFFLLSYRISLTLACPMDLKLYPLDRQECEMRIASCKFFLDFLDLKKLLVTLTAKSGFSLFKLSDGWTTADLIYKWKELDPVQIVNDLNLPRFKLERFSTDYCNTKTNTGKNG